MQNILALNWKMNKTPTEAAAWAAEVKEGLKDKNARLIVLAPTVNLHVLQRDLPEGVEFGAQDLSVHDSGAYTGEVSGAMLKDAGARWVVVGHSERREYHGERSETVAQKAAAAQRQGLGPIVCVGEGLAVRERGEHVPFTLEQLRASLEGVSTENLIVAYEPVWAIGTGKTATEADAEEMAAAIRGLLGELYGENTVPVLYGGSVKPDNIAALCQKEHVGGALVGGASLKSADVLAMNDALK